MTLSVTTDHALVRSTIRTWLMTYAVLGEVIYANQTTERPPKPYGTLLVLSSGLRSGLDEHIESFNGGSQLIERITAGPRQLVAQVEVYTDPATTPSNEAAELLENALLALDTVLVKDVFRVAKIGVLGHTSATRLDEQLGDRWERRAVADVTFTYSGETFDDGVTGESGNWIETVEIPTEDNGNATYNQ